MFNVVKKNILYDVIFDSVETWVYKVEELETSNYILCFNVMTSDTSLTFLICESVVVDNVHLHSAGHQLGRSQSESGDVTT